MPPVLNLARTLAPSAVNGPGERFVVWVQGCPLQCAGCWNPDTWSLAARSLVDPSTIADEVLSTPGIEGLTITGGEPFVQAGALSVVARRVREGGLSVLIYTGYELSELRTDEQRTLLTLADVVVAGRFVRSRRSLRDPWKGSANQTVHFLTGRYSASDARHAGCEAHIGADGALVWTGFPDEALFAASEPSATRPGATTRP